MKNTELMTRVTRSLNKMTFQIKKHSPEILVVAGVAGVVTSAIMACKATTKVQAILDDTGNQLDVIHSCMETGEVRGETYTEEDGKKDLALVYIQTGVKLAKLYAPSVILGSLSIAGILTSNNILRKRNVALAAAYTAVDTSFKSYRNRVIDRFGKELDRELRYNIKAKDIEEIVTDENGNETTVTKTVNIIDPNEIGDFARIYYEGNIGWTKNAEDNLYFLKTQQAYANQKLKTRGYLFLNEVYEMLGFAPTAVGAVTGWYYDEKDPVGDNFVDFGIYQAPEFVNGVERSILLDFNCDGNILKYL